MMHDFSERVRAARKAAEASYDLGRDEPETEARNAPPPRNDIVTEDSAACEFTALYEGRLLYCHSSGSWFEWNGSAWRPDRTGKAFQWAREMIRRLVSDERDKARFVASKTSFALGVERFARSDPAFAVTADAWDADPWLLGTPGGTVDLRTGQLRPARPDERITKLAAVAPARLPDCPLWLAFLEQATGGDAELDLLRFSRERLNRCPASRTGQG
ncbi:hypothetical protein [Methylobacterium sp. WSM2598]|uniref:hypothetical protein n=1 Tax=Methylobacterium sp. WSM2598 TaxID=398261 RepID=UPI000A00B957|nr:hypothetical protein [Methylobacterium sp. WSM2598]